MSQKKLGVVLSYLTTIITALMNIVFVPFFISKLGAAEYGVYKIMNSFAGYLIIMDMGVGTIVTRYVSLYRHKLDNDRIKKCVSTSAVVCIVLSIIVLIIGFMLYINIDVIYANTLSINQRVLAHKLFILMIINIDVTLITHLFTGYINAYEKFAYTNGLSVLRLIIRIIVIFLSVSISKNALTIIIVDLAINFCLLIVYIMYCVFELKMKISFSMFDRNLVKQYTIFSSAILFQSIVNQVNNSVDNMILGAMVSPEIVTMYSSGLTIYGLYVTLPEAINSVFLPEATRLFGEKIPNDNGLALTNFVSRIGRYEAVICLGILGAFSSFGQDFVILWIGRENIGAWRVALMLIIPVTIPMCENLMVTVLNACNKRMVRSIVLACIAVFNIITTIVLIPKIGYIGAAIGTFLSILLGHGIVLNYYYHKVFKLKVFYMLKKVYLRVLPCCAIAFFLTTIFSVLVKDVSWTIFIIKGITYIFIYALSIYFYCFSKEERSMVLNIFEKLTNIIKGK